MSHVRVSCPVCHAEFRRMVFSETSARRWAVSALNWLEERSPLEGAQKSLARSSIAVAPGPGVATSCWTWHAICGR